MNLCVYRNSVWKAFMAFVAISPLLLGQSTSVRTGIEVPADVERISNSAVEWLAKNQTPAGNWDGGVDGHNPEAGNCGVTGLCMMAFLSTGGDPNFGEYGVNIRSALRNMIGSQDPKTGFLPNSMYHHGFAMLALAEAYGAVDEELLWSEKNDVPKERQRTLGEALQLAVRCAITSQENNPWKAWRYLPAGRDADTSVTGAVIVGLLAARNAGIKVPDSNIDDALIYIREVTGKRGEVNYTPGFSIGTGTNLPAIACLVYAISKHQDWPEYKAVSAYVKANREVVDPGYPHYNMYYMSQALFQSDFESWTKWNQTITRRLRREQSKDGSFDSNHGKAYGTAMSVLALALNYRFLPIYER